MRDVNDFRIGDTVVLKSMSITMVIEKLNGEEVTCVWFNDLDGRMYERVCNKAILKRVDPPTDDPSADEPPGDEPTPSFDPKDYIAV